jgi:hypothetical protein
MSFTCECGNRMRCVDTRQTDNGKATRRLYRCSCGHRFTTLERPYDAKPGSQPPQLGARKKSLSELLREAADKIESYKENKQGCPL